MKKNNIAGLFLRSLLKSILGLVIILGMGFASYKISYMVLSNNSTNVGTSSNIKSIIEEAQTDEVSKNLIYVYDGKNITHLLLEICNTKTNNMDYVTIPVKTDYTIPTTMYQKLCTVNEEIPQIVRLGRLKQYFSDEYDAYGYGELIIESMLGIKISYYTAIPQELYDSHYKEINTNVTFKPQSLLETYADYTEDENITVTETISVAGDTYINQLKALAGSEEKIAEYIKEQYEKVDSNLTVYNKIGYIESYENMNVDYFHYWGIPGVFNGNVFNVDTKASKKYLNNLIDNEVRYTKSQDLTKVSKTDNIVSSKGKNIIVLNGSRVTGLAAATKTKLSNAGFTVSRLGDYTDAILRKTKIIVKEDGVGKDLKDYFKNPEITVGTVDEGYDIKIILGTAEVDR